MASKISRVKTTKWPALTISRIALHADQLVYIAQANRAIRYPNGERSAIAYIGTTKNGIARIASSAAWKSRDILSHHGVNHLEFFVVTAQAKPRVNIPRKLERALLLRFKERFGGVPIGNKQGNRLRWHDELDFFTHAKLDKVLDSYS